MNPTSRQFTCLLFLNLVVNIGSGNSRLVQTLLHVNHTRASIRSLRTLVNTSSNGNVTEVHAGSESRPNDASSARPAPQRLNDDRVNRFSNTSRITRWSTNSTWRAVLDMKHPPSPARDNSAKRTDNISILSALYPKMTASVGEATNNNNVLYDDSPLSWSVAYTLSPEDVSSKAFQNRSRRDAFPLLPDNYVERQSYFSARETCRQHELVHVLRPPGCLRRVVRTSSCQGTCHSRSVPHWDIDQEQLRHVAYCTCCKPHQLSYRRTRFRCPGRQRKVLVLFVGVATQCACRPCSEGDPAPQHPYDY